MTRTTRWKGLLSCSAALFFLNACGAPPEGTVAGTWKSEREQRGDTLIVRTLSGSVWGDTMSLVPDVAIGELAGSPAVVFGEIRGLDLDADGRLLLVDRQSREVRIFSETGEHVLSFGQSGDGPGEFRAPDHLRVVSDGRIVIRDQGAARFSVFSRDGKYLGGWPHAPGFSTTSPFYLDPGERVVTPTFTDTLVVYELDGTPLDTIAVPSLGHSTPQLTVNGGGGTASYTIPFMPSEKWTMTRDGRVIIGFPAGYSFERRDNNGRVLRIERLAETIPVADAEAAQARDRIVTNIRSRNNPDWQWRGPEIPSVKPVFNLILTGIDGTIWVFREDRSVEEPNPYYKASEPDTGYPTYWRGQVVADVFDEEGRYLGPVKIPETINWYSPPPILSREWIWATAMNDAGVPQVVRFRVAPR